MKWIDEIEVDATRDAAVFMRAITPEDDSILEYSKCCLRLIRALRGAEAALVKIHKRAKMHYHGPEGLEYIEDVSMDALGFIARGGDEQ